jgi:hypothetical protein
MGIQRDEFSRLAAPGRRKAAADYGITIDDSGVDDEYLMPHWQMKQSPYEFVEWFGIKYDLTPRSDLEWGGPQR